MSIIDIPALRDELSRVAHAKSVPATKVRAGVDALASLDFLDPPASAMLDGVPVELDKTLAPNEYAVDLPPDSP